jgi:hypothetical protein
VQAVLQPVEIVQHDEAPPGYVSSTPRHADPNLHRLRRRRPLWPCNHHFERWPTAPDSGPYADHATSNARLYDVQRATIQLVLFGYGAKSFMLSDD